MAKVNCKNVFTFHAYLKNAFIEVPIYTNIDFFGNDERVNKEALNAEEFVEQKYFTKERIEELKRKMCEQIMSCDNPFDISCLDYDGDYVVEESDLLENIVKID